MLVNFFFDENLLLVDYIDKFNFEFSGVGSKLIDLLEILKSKINKRIMVMVIFNFNFVKKKRGIYIMLFLF